MSDNVLDSPNGFDLREAVNLNLIKAQLVRLSSTVSAVELESEIDIMSRAEKAKQKYQRLSKLKNIRFGWIDLVWVIAFIWWFLTAETFPWILAIAIRFWWWWRKQDGHSLLSGMIEEKIPENVRKEAVSSTSGGCIGIGLKLLAILLATIFLVQFFGFFALFLGLVAAIVWLRKPEQPKIQDGVMTLPKPWLRALLGKPLTFFDHNTLSKNGIKFGFRLFGFDKRSNISSDQVAELNVDDHLLDFLLGAVVVTVSSTSGDGEVEAEVVVARWADTATMEKQMRAAYLGEE